MWVVQLRKWDYALGNWNDCMEYVKGGSGYYGNQYEESSNNFKTPKTQDQLATSMGMTVQTLHNYKLLSDMIPELVELLRINLMALYLDTEKRIILYVVEQ